MALIRVQPVTTSLTADGTKAGVLTLASTTGIPRHCFLSIDNAAGGWRVEVIRVVDANSILARMAGFTACSGTQSANRNINDLSVIPNGSTVILEEQWVADLYSDDIPDTLAIPTK